MTSAWRENFVYAEQFLKLPPEVKLQLSGCLRSESLTDSKKNVPDVLEGVNNALST